MKRLNVDLNKLTKDGLKAYLHLIEEGAEEVEIGVPPPFNVDEDVDAENPEN